MSAITSWTPFAPVAGVPPLTPAVLAAIIDQVPEPWLESIPGAESAAEKRAAYLDFFLRRLAAARVFEEEATRARLV